MNSYVIILSLDKVPYIPVSSIQYVFFTEHGFRSTVPHLFTNKYVAKSDKRCLMTHFIVLQYTRKCNKISPQTKIFYCFIFIPITLAIESCFTHLLIPFLSKVMTV